MVVAFRWFGATQPDFVFAELGGDVGDDFAHVDASAGAEVAFEAGGLGGFEDEAQLFGEVLGQAGGERGDFLPGLLRLTVTRKLNTRKR